MLLSASSQWSYLHHCKCLYEYILQLFQYTTPMKLNPCWWGELDLNFLEKQLKPGEFSVCTEVFGLFWTQNVTHNTSPKASGHSKAWPMESPEILQARQGEQFLHHLIRQCLNVNNFGVFQSNDSTYVAFSEGQSGKKDDGSYKLLWWAVPSPSVEMDWISNKYTLIFPNS